MINIKNLNDIRNIFKELDKKLGYNTSKIELMRFDSATQVIKIDYAKNKSIIDIKFNQEFFNVPDELFETIARYGYACVVYNLTYKLTLHNGSQWKSLCKRIGVRENILSLPEIQEILNKNRDKKAQYSIVCPYCNNESKFLKLTPTYISYQNGNLYTCKICGRKFTKENRRLKFDSKRNANNIINDFSNDNFYLSNFYYSNITYEGIEYKSIEAAFQASKTTNFDIKKKLSLMSPSQARVEGEKITPRENWDETKLIIMKELIILKFTFNPNLRNKLINTGNTSLVNNNNWGDKYWGVCDGEGDNRLGIILMEVRNLLSLQ